MLNIQVCLFVLYFMLKSSMKLSSILFSGNMGKVFDLSWEPLFGPQLALTNFSQLMTVTSGGVEVSNTVKKTRQF